MKILVTCSAALAALFAGATLAQSQTQVWDYVSYKRDRTSGQFMKDLGNPGTLELIESDGKASFRIIAGKLDACYRGNIAATVDRTPQATTITMVEALPGCPLFRYVIRNDGSGGTKEIQRDGAWHDEKFDHGLTPHK